MDTLITGASTFRGQDSLIVEVTRPSWLVGIQHAAGTSECSGFLSWLWFVSLTSCAALHLLLLPDA